MPAMRTLTFGLLTAALALSLAACAATRKSALAPQAAPAAVTQPEAPDGGRAHPPPMKNMSSYWLVLLRRGPPNPKRGKAELDELFQGHFANINLMAKTERLVAAGPFGTQGANPDYAGLFLIHTDTLAEARAMVEVDPTIKAGVFIPEYREWWGGLDLFETARQRVESAPPQG